MRKLKNILVTGGAGFIGSNFIHYLFKQTDFDGTVINVDKLTYAGNPENLSEIETTYGGKRYFFEKIDICDLSLLSLFTKYNIDTVVHFAAESHVDRSILGPGEFIRTNIMGTFNLLESAREFWNGREDVLFHYINTDEVYGSLGKSGYFTEETPYNPRSPYSASKASASHLVQSYFHTFNLPVTMSNCSNNYGPYQFPEKLIPLMIQNVKEEKPLPIYGTGENIRDWLHVEDHNSAVWLIMNEGNLGETYNIGGDTEKTNLEIVVLLCNIVGSILRKNPHKYIKLIKYVTDRPGHDFRYAIDCSKLKNTLRWKCKYSFDLGLYNTVTWYLNNNTWITNIKNGEYQNWIDKNYNNR